MRRLSLKGKLTLLYTALMTAVVCGVLAILFSLSGKEILSLVQNRLETTVSQAVDDIELDDGVLEFDSDLMNLEHGVYLSVYDADGILLYGKIPYGFDNSALFEDGTVRQYNLNGTAYYLMDLFYRIEGYGWTVIRGIVSITDAEEGFLMTVRLAVILLPLMVALTAVMGYFMTKRTLRPVSRITDTVREIQRDGDLSRRINLGDGRDEIYRMAATFDEMLHQVEVSMKREQQFTSDVSHELRTPVAAMMLQCEELQKHEYSDPKIRAGIRMLSRKTQYLSTMITQLLFLTRADQGRQRLAMERVDFSELTAMVCEEISESASWGQSDPEPASADAAKEITVESQIEEGIFLHGDETLLIRFWMNLLNNAVTYGKQGGHIRVTLKKENGRAAGTVADDGIGISESDLPHIWERFYQADPSRTGENSSGLGLSMVQWIVRAHNGEITVKSRLGEGTVFSFWFPAADEERGGEAYVYDDEARG